MIGSRTGAVDPLTSGCSLRAVSLIELAFQRPSARASFQSTVSTDFSPLVSSRLLAVTVIFFLPTYCASSFMRRMERNGPDACNEFMSKKQAVPYGGRHPSCDEHPETR